MLNRTTACQGWVEKYDEPRLTIVNTAPSIMVHLQPSFLTRIDEIGAKIEKCFVIVGTS